MRTSLVLTKYYTPKRWGKTQKKRKKKNYFSDRSETPGRRRACGLARSTRPRTLPEHTTTPLVLSEGPKPRPISRSTLPISPTSPTSTTSRRRPGPPPAASAAPSSPSAAPGFRLRPHGHPGGNWLRCLGMTVTATATPLLPSLMVPEISSRRRQRGRLSHSI